MLKLQKTGEINVIGANKSTTIKVCSFKSYQDKSEPKETTGASKRANQGETKGKPRGNAILYTKKDKNDKNTIENPKKRNTSNNKNSYYSENSNQ